MTTWLKWLPVVSTDRCDGCGRCVEACGPGCLAITDGIAALTRPDGCGSEEHGIPVCERQAIGMDWVPFTGDRSVGRWGGDEGSGRR
jgi:NAD-dependent dihydropyrimidine dehydrogenase PreA subunit